jgi:Dolichyl-phosphate-mannose-protein mannosyltransferase
MGRRYRSLEVFYPLLLAVLVAVLYNSILGYFWLGDDPLILKHAILYRPWEYFFVPGVWQKGTVSNFTPWVVFSFDLDHRLFGVDPAGFYLHQLASLCLLVAVLYFVLRLWLSSVLSFLGVLLFIVSPPFARLSQMLMVRHYLEGFVFAALSVYCFTRDMRESRGWLKMAGIFFYMLAVSAKEIYVPLPFFLLLLREGSLRGRLRRVVPWLIVLSIYVFWRWFMLGRLVGGYSETSAWFKNIMLFPSRVVDAMGGMQGPPVPWWLWLIGSSSVLSGAVIALSDRKSLLRVLAVSLLLLLPIFPVSSIMSPRYVWLPFFFWIVLHLIAWNKLNNMMKKTPAKFIISLWCITLLACFAYVSLSNSSLTREGIKRQGEEGRFVLDGGSATDLLINPSSSGWYYSGLSWLRKDVLHLGQGPSAISDSSITCLGRVLGEKDDDFIHSFKRIWYFDAQHGALVAEDVKDFCRSESLRGVRMDKPLSMNVDYDRAVFAWTFGPYQKGEYTLFIGRTSESKFLLPKNGKAFISFKGETVYLRLRYISPEGWRSYSPLVKLVAKGDRGSVQWRR